MAARLVDRAGKGTPAPSVPRTVAVVVDVLSFTTTVTLATSRGARVHPYRWAGDGARRRADELGVQLAAGRDREQGGPETVGLSPGSVVTAATVPDLLLPSPNGSTVATLLADAGVQVVAGCLLNADAVGEWLRARRATDPGATVLVVPAGERWPDDSLRPAYEDLWGAGAIIAALDLQPVDLSLEARMAVAAYRAVEDDLLGALRECASGRELTHRGYGQDVRIAAELHTLQAVPVLRDGYFSADPESWSARW